jgi:hypothetical protein
MRVFLSKIANDKKEATTFKKLSPLSYFMEFGVENILSS